MKLGFKAEALCRELREDIARGRFSPGERLPTEKELCGRFQAGRGTVRVVLKQLADEGLLESVQGSGSYIKDMEKRGSIVSLMFHGDMEMVIHVQNLLLERGVLMSLFSQRVQGWDPVLEAKFLEQVLARRQPGLIASCTPLQPHNTLLLEKLENRGTHVVHVEPYSGDELPAQDYVMPDYYDAGRQAAEYLFRRGHKRIHYISQAGETTPYAALMGRGCADAAKRLGLELSAQFSGKADFQPDGIDVTGIVAVPYSLAEELVETAGLDSGRIVSLELAGDEKRLRLPVMSFDRKSIFNRAVEAIFTPGMSIRELVPARLELWKKHNQGTEK